MKKKPSRYLARPIELLSQAAQPIFALEKRIAFDGAAVGTVAKAALAAHVTEHVPAALDASHVYGLDALKLRSENVLGTYHSEAARSPNSVVFIESDVPDIGTLIRNIAHSAKIVILDSGQDGVDEIANYLSQHKGVDNVYIFSHGSDANLKLGTADLNSTTMQGRYASDLAEIRASLGKNANILVYGCDFAEYSDGDSAAHLLSQMTGASVAASTNETGGTKLGGDFILEDRIGTITAPDILSSRVALEYNGLLATQNTGAFTINTGTSGAATSSATVATAYTADGAVKVVVTVTPTSTNSSGSITTTTGATFDTTAPTSAYTTSVNGSAALEETLQFGGTTGGTDGANSATITIAYFDAKTGAAITVTNPIIDIDRIGGSATNSSRTVVSNSSDLTITTSGATLSKLSGSSSAFNVSSTDIYETVNTALANGFSADANADPTKGTSAGTVQVNGSYSTLTFNWSKAAGSLNGGDRIDLIFSADTSMAKNGSLASKTFTDGQSGISVDTAGGFSNPSGLTTTYSATGLPAGLSIDPTTGKITGTIDHDASKNAPTTTGSGATLDGTYSVTVTATNSANNSVTQTFTIDSKNTAPVVGTKTANQINNDGDAITPVNAAAAFSDPNGDPLTYTASGLPAGLSISSAGVISGTVAKNAAPGTYAVNVTATDDKGAATVETFNWVVKDVPPVTSGTLVNQVYTDGQSGISIATSQGFSDANGNTLTYSATGLPAGLSINSVTGKITGTIDHDASKNAPTTTGSGANLDGTYTVKVTASDGLGGSATQTFTIDSKNTAPVVGTKTANQTNNDGDTITAVNAAAAFSDPNGDPLTYTASGLPAGLSISSAGLISGTVAKNAAPGTYSVNVTAADDKGAMTTEVFSWVIKTATPVTNGTLANQTYTDGQSGISIATSQGFSDASGNTLTYSATGLPAGLSIDPTTGKITGTIDHDASKNAPTTTGSGATLDGTYTVKVTASDAFGNSAIQTFTIDTKNTAPVVGTKTANQTNNDGDAITPVNAAAAFSDPNGDPLTYTASGLPAGLSISSAGVISGTIAKNAAPGTYSVNVTSTDDKGAATVEAFNWVVKAVPPVANGTLANQTYTDGQSGISIATSQAFTDANGNALTYSATGLPAGLSIDSTTGKITGTIDHDASKNAPTTTGSGANLDGTYTVKVTASDGLGGSATQTFTIDATNTAPVVGTKTANQTNNDGDTITAVNAAAAFSDPNGDSLTYTASGLPAGLSIDANSGMISGTVAANATPGTYAVRVIATDDKGAQTRETFTWTINDVPPTTKGTLANLTYADSTANILIATAGGFSSPNGLALTYSATGLPPGLSIEAVTGKITGQLDHDASKNAPVTSGSGATLDGTYTVTVVASDGQGGTATQTFTIDAKNTAPTVTANTPDQHDADGNRVSVDAAAAFSDANIGDTFTYSATGLPAGLAIDPNTGLISGTIDKSASTKGPYTVTVTETDDKGAATTETFHWQVDNVALVATPPLADQSAYDGSNVSYATSGGFTNPNALTLTYTATGLPTGLTINSTTGVISGTLDHDASIEIANGVYTIAVTANDGQGSTATNTFHLTASNQAPVVGTKTSDQTSNDGATVPIVDASKAFSDPNDDPLTYSASNLPPGLTIDPTSGKITGTVLGNAAPGIYSVSVTATDDKGATSSETFHWTVADVPPAANGTLQNQTFADSSSVSVDTSGGFTNPNGLPLTYSASGLPTGLSIDATTGKITGQLNHDASSQAPSTTGSGATLDGTYSIVVTASDGQGGTATQTFTIDAKNTAPVVVATTPDQHSTEGNVVSVNVAIAFTDANTGDVLTYMASGLPNGLSIDPNTGRITGTIASDGSAVGSHNVTVTATDDKGAAITETFAYQVDALPPGNVSPIPNTSTFDGATVSIDTASHFISPDGTPLIYTSSTLPAGLSIDATTGQISGTLSHDASKNAQTTTGSGATLDGTYPITVTATGTGGSVMQTFNLDVANQAPTVTNRTGDQTNATGQTVSTVDASQAFVDPNGDPLTYSASNLPAGLTIDPNSGKITGTIAANAMPGTYAVSVTAIDDKGAATVETFSWVVSDTPPTANGTIAGQSYSDSTSGIAIATAGRFTSPNGLPLTFSASGLPAGLSIDPVTGKITGQLDHDASALAPVTSGSGATLDGTYTVVVTASDGLGGTAQQTFTIDATNAAPTIVATTADQHSADGNNVSVDASKAFSDPNVGDKQTYTASGLPAGLTIDPATGLISGTIAANASQHGPYTVSVTSTDDKGAATTEIFHWQVDNVPPVATPPLADRSAYDGSTVNYDTSQGFLNPNGLTLTYSATGLPPNVTINSTTGLISGTLSHDASIQIANGVYTIAVTASDGQGGSATNIFHLTATDQAPVIETKTADQASTANQTVSTVDASTAFVDPNGDPLTFAASNLPAGLSIDPATGKISGTVAGGVRPGSYLVTVTATDDKGVANSETFIWAIDTVLPVANGTLPAQTFADGTNGVSIATAGGFTNPNGTPLTYTVTGLPRGLSIDASTGVISGFIQHNASANAPVTSGMDGIYTVKVTATDIYGGFATQSFTIDAKNSAPLVTAPTPSQHSTDGDTVSLDASKAFMDPNLGDTVTFAASGLPAGLAIDSATGLITGTIDKTASASGPYSVNVTATDNKGAATTETFTWQVGDLAPTTSSAIAPVSAGDGTAIAPIDTAGHFANPNGLPLTYTASGLPTGLSIDPATGRITGTLSNSAAADAPTTSGSGATLRGTYTITVTVSDGQGGTAMQTFDFSATNAAPVIVSRTPDQLSANGAQASVDTSMAFSDPNGDRLIYSAANLPPGLTIDATTGVISGTLASNASSGAPYAVSVTATDPAGAAATEIFVWRVGMNATAATAPVVPYVEVRAIQGAQSSPLDSVVAQPDTDLRQTTEHVEGVILDAVNHILPLDGLPPLSEHGIVVATVEATIRPAPSFNSPFADDVVTTAPVEDVGSSSHTENLFAGEAGVAINVETLVRNRTITITADNRSDTACVVPVKMWDITQADGSTLPDWLHVAGKGSVTGIVPSGVEMINIKIKATLANGIITERTVKIDTNAGHINARQGLAGRRHPGLSTR